MYSYSDDMSEHGEESDLPVRLQRAGTAPRTVEVGMVLCRPADGICASAWRVESVRAGVSVVLADCDHPDRRLPVAIAAIVHEAGGWVLAEDWAPQEAGE